MASCSFDVLASLIFAIQFVLLSFTITNSLSKHSEVILKWFLYSSFIHFKKEILHLIRNWFRNSCLLIFYKIGVPKNFAKFTEKRLCWSHFLTKLQVSRNYYSCWFLLSNQGFIHWSHFVHFFLDFFLSLLIIAIMEFVQKVYKNKDFFTFYNSLCKN